MLKMLNNVTVLNINRTVTIILHAKRSKLSLPVVFICLENPWVPANSQGSLTKMLGGRGGSDTPSCFMLWKPQLKELCHDNLGHFCEVQNHLQIEESLKIIVY